MTTAQSHAPSVQQHQKTYDKAIEFYSLFEDADAPELLRMQKTLAEDVQNLLNISDLSWESYGILGRHLNFLHRYRSTQCQLSGALSCCRAGLSAARNVCKKHNEFRYSLFLHYQCTELSTDRWTLEKLNLSLRKQALQAAETWHG